MRVSVMKHKNRKEFETIQKLVGPIKKEQLRHVDSRVFKKETGQTPINYLNQLRMARVKKLLLDEHKSISQIAIECGLGSSSYLSACFQEIYKMSPSDYRNILFKDRKTKFKNISKKARLDHFP